MCKFLKLFYWKKCKTKISCVCFCVNRSLQLPWDGIAGKYNFMFDFLRKCHSDSTILDCDLQGMHFLVSPHPCQQWMCLLISLQTSKWLWSGISLWFVFSSPSWLMIGGFFVYLLTIVWFIWKKGIQIIHIFLNYLSFYYFILWILIFWTWIPSQIYYLLVYFFHSVGSLFYFLVVSFRAKTF